MKSEVKYDRKKDRQVRNTENGKLTKKKGRTRRRKAEKVQTKKNK
jgi:hypothetical protein